MTIRKPENELSQQEFVYRRAQMLVDMANCFWGADATLYGVDFASKVETEAVEYQRSVASNIISGNYDFPVAPSI